MIVLLMLVVIFTADFPKERAPVVLAPLLYPESQDISPEK